MSLHTPFTINPSDKIPMVRNVNNAYLKAYVSVAQELKVTHKTTHSGYCLGFEHWKHEALARLISILEEVLEECQEHRMNLAIENGNPQPKYSE